MAHGVNDSSSARSSAIRSRSRSHFSSSPRLRPSTVGRRWVVYVHLPRSVVSRLRIPLLSTCLVAGLGDLGAARQDPWLAHRDVLRLRGGQHNVHHIRSDLCRVYVPSSTVTPRRHVNANADDAYPLAHIVGACIGYLPREYFAFGLVALQHS